LTPELERETRRRRIDPRLKAAGWKVVPFDESKLAKDYGPAAAVEEYETPAGPADYALCDSARTLGVVEAKKLTVGPDGVLTQAHRYANEFVVTEDAPTYESGLRVPFLYSTNGERILFHDARATLNRSREVSAFHTPAALREMLERDLDGELEQLRKIPVHDRMRPYQNEASEALETALGHRQRKMLVTMATGTGKTLTTVNEVYRLMKSGVARRVLFLVDRKSLAAQTVRAFKSFEPEPGKKFDNLYEVYSQRFQREDFGDDEQFDPTVLPKTYLTDPKVGSSFVYICTIQRMTINLFGRGAVFTDEEGIEDDAEQLDIPIHAFDLIVADECHRGYSSSEAGTWRKTLDHFDTIKIGLTATPAQHTMAYFENLVYRYDYERAVREGFLVDYDVVRLKSDVRMNGVFLKEGEAIDNVDPESGQQQFDYLEDERIFDTTEIERKITSPDSNRKILQEIKRYCDEHQAATGRFPKTLIFAVNDLPHTSHADQLVKQAREVFDQGEAFLTKITGRADRPLQRIREFRNRPKPMVVVSVDMLTTGVDIPDLEFIVFLRPVRSRILFEQMLGRGTRLGERYPDKANFVVFDCFDGTLLEYFRKTTDITAEPPPSDTKTISEVIDDIWANRDREYSINRLVKRLQRIEKQMAGEAREQFAAYIPDGDLGRYATGLKARLHDSFSEAMKLLRDEGFQDLLVNYKRPPRSFIVAHTVSDTVESGWLIRGADGQEYKPEDYLQAFERFVRENRAHIEALQILLSRPQDWSTEALKELRDSLVKAPQRFSEANLRKAFEAKHHKALIDIISMVKSATLDGSSLFTAEERVNAAVTAISAARALTDDQAKWMDYIRQHLIQNLTIDRDDFDNVPILANRGGWGRANRVFDGQLAELLSAVNKELVAA
jgi:type I restriction enzyme R subunit